MTTGKAELINGETGEVIEAETDLALLDNAGEIENATFDDLIDAGFTAVRKIKCGDPEFGGVAAYAGEIIGPGEPIEAALEGRNQDGTPYSSKSLLPTWIANPAKVVKRSNGVVEFIPQAKVTHILITPHQLNAECAQLFVKLKDREGNKVRRGFFAFRWDGKHAIKGGAKQLNMYSWREQIKVGDVAAE